MSTDSKPCCALCTPAGLDVDPHDRIREIILDKGWAVQQVMPGSPYQPGFAYTIGLEGLGQPELIVFGHDLPAMQHLLNATAEKTASRKDWNKRFQVTPQPGHRVQLRPALDLWRDTYATFAHAHWGEEPFRLWQVRRPRKDGSFSWNGVCCQPPCQPLLDQPEPWLPVEHDRSPVGVPLWHRVVNAHGRWDGRWEKFSGFRLDDDSFVVLDVPFIADDVAMGDVVSTTLDSSGRRLITGVKAQSDVVTVRVDGHGAEQHIARIESALLALVADAEVDFECGHLHHLPYWVLGVAEHRLEWAEKVLRPLRRDGVIDYQMVRR